MQTLTGVITDILKQELTSMHEKKENKKGAALLDAMRF